MASRPLLGAEIAVVCGAKYARRSRGRGLFAPPNGLNLREASTAWPANLNATDLGRPIDYRDESVWFVGASPADDPVSRFRGSEGTSIDTRRR